jgi:hypothetical protein
MRGSHWRDVSLSMLAPPKATGGQDDHNAMATGVGNRRAARELAFRFLFDSFILLKSRRPCEPPA